MLTQLVHPTFAYDALNRVTQTRDARGEETTYTYDPFGNLATMTDALGHTQKYRYDARNRLVASLDAAGNRTNYRYDLDDNITLIEDALGNTTRNSYDARGRITRTEDAAGRRTRYFYDREDNLLLMADRNGNLTQYEYDDLNRLTQLTNALGHTLTTVYDEVGNVATRIDSRGNATDYDYDQRNRLTQVTDALNGISRYEYDDVGNLLATRDQLNRTTAYEYDAQNRLTRVIDPLNHATRYSYDAVDNLIAVEDALSRRTQFQYDALNRLERSIDANGGVVTRRYDAVDNVTAITDELGRTTRFGYDQRNLQTTVTNPLGHTSTTDYDAVGNVSTMADALGHTTTYTYDPLYRRTQIQDPLGNFTRMSYDPEGNLLSLTDASNNLTTYTYDKLNRLKTDTITVNGQALTRTLAYDATDNLVSSTDRNGRKTAFAYDALNRLQTEQWLDANDNPLRAINYTYDAASQLQLVSDPDAIYAYDYDLAGRLTEVDNHGTPDVPQVVFNYGYDAANNLTTVTDTINGAQAGVEAFTYDLLNRVTRITQSGNGINAKRVDMTYDAASQMTGIQRYSDLAGNQSVADSVYDYDLAGQLTDLTHQRGNTTLADYDLTYDAANRLTQFVTPDGTSDYTYNNRNELTSGDHTYQTDETYTYDATGNRTNHTTGNHNRLLSDGQYSYTYDPEGNRTRQVDTTTGEITDYTWDYRNRLTTVVTKASNGIVLERVEYTYDAYDRRITKTIDPDGAGPATATEEHFVYDGDHIALVFDETGSETHRYLHGPQIDQILAEETADGTHWALSDHQGSVRDVIDNAGIVLNHIVYDSFGQVTRETNPAFDFRFGYTGRELDEETGLLYYRARYYDPAVGTFVSTDPLGFGAGDANLYRYVGNSPTNFTDPSGYSAIALRGVASGGFQQLGQFGRNALGVAGRVAGVGGRALGAAGSVLYVPGGGGLLNPLPTARDEDYLRYLQSGSSAASAGSDAIMSGGWDPTLDSNYPLYQPPAPRIAPLNNTAAPREYYPELDNSRPVGGFTEGGFCPNPYTETFPAGASVDPRDFIFTSGPDPKWTSTQTGNTSDNSAILRENLGIPRNSGLDAHHIVPSTDRRAQLARNILDKYQIDINAAINGVALIGGKGASQDDLPRHHHGSGLHSNIGVARVNTRIVNAQQGINDWAEAQAAVTAELESIRNEIIDGSFP